MPSFKEFKGLADGTVEFTNISRLGTFRTCYLPAIRFYSDAEMTNRIFPSSGTVTAQFRSGNDDEWRNFTQSAITDYAFGSDWPPKVSGATVRAIRLIFDGLPSNTYFDAEYYLTRDADGMLDPRVMTGSQALTTQNFPEANSKNGTQYEVTGAFFNITNLSPVYVGFETGDLPVIIKQRDIYGSFVNADFDVFKNAEYTGGTVINSFNNNDLVIRPALSTVTINPTVTVEGAPFGAKTYLFGSEATGNRILSTFGDAAGEKILAPNTKYLAKVTNNVAATAIALLGLRIYFYEGPLSTQI